MTSNNNIPEIELIIKASTIDGRRKGACIFCQEYFMDLYNKFKVMLVKRDEASKKAVITLLQRINDTLGAKGTRFLTGETLCCFDCELMPKLQHIRVAGKFFVGFEIPPQMTHLWNYIREMYKLDAFTQSCPADQDIIHMYKMQQQFGSFAKIKSREELEVPTYTTTVPSEMA